MAELVDAPPPRSRKTRYPYDAWFLGRWVKLTRGEDFSKDPQTVSNCIASYAARHEIVAKVEVRRDNELPGQPWRFIYVWGDPSLDIDCGLPADVRLLLKS